MKDLMWLVLALALAVSVGCDADGTVTATTEEEDDTTPPVEQTNNDGWSTLLDVVGNIPALETTPFGTVTPSGPGTLKVVVTWSIPDNDLVVWFEDPNTDETSNGATIFSPGTFTFHVDGGEWYAQVRNSFETGNARVQISFLAD